jgi:hypothetical protein
MTPLQTAKSLSIEPIEAGDHEHVAGVELIEGAALIGAVIHAPLRERPGARPGPVHSKSSFGSKVRNLWRYTGGAQGRTATRSSGDERLLRCIIWWRLEAKRKCPAHRGIDAIAE